MTTGLLPNGKLGGATPYIVKMNYDYFKQGLAADGTANIGFLPTSNESIDKYSVMLEDGSIDNSFYEIMQTTANNKALGNDISGNASGLDLYIQLENSVDWSFNYVNGNTPGNKYDFVSVVLHEIGHVLGFVSGIDIENSEIDELPSALDIFRYSSQIANQGAIDFRVGGTKYFSNDGGQTQIGEFSTGLDTSLGGDGDQASHWKANAQSYLGIMSSTIQKGETRTISALDLTAFDYIGWDVNHSAQLNLSALYQSAKNKANNIWGNSNYILDRSSDVESMIEDSGIYNWGFNGYSQKFATSENSIQVKSTPEPTSFIGLLGLGLLGIISRSQGFLGRKRMIK
ncbi:MAG: NF038122 family metalloprotease [Rivularia sp. ALOHA_DT_140]|nr:NF038122 family metalloprotease [Rivularia sp. ALOHA_DT_140]